MEITFDPVKRDKTLKKRDLDFADAALVFVSRTYTKQDLRFDYGEPRFQTLGFLAGRNGDGCLDAARRGAAFHLDEEVQ